MNNQKNVRQPQLPTEEGGAGESERARLHRFWRRWFCKAPKSNGKQPREGTMEALGQDRVWKPSTADALRQRDRGAGASGATTLAGEEAKPTRPAAQKGTDAGEKELGPMMPGGGEVAPEGRQVIDTPPEVTSEVAQSEEEPPKPVSEVAKGEGEETLITAPEAEVAELGQEAQKPITEIPEAEKLPETVSKLQDKLEEHISKDSKLEGLRETVSELQGRLEDLPERVSELQNSLDTHIRKDQELQKLEELRKTGLELQSGVEEFGRRLEQITKRRASDDRGQQDKGMPAAISEGVPGLTPVPPPLDIKSLAKKVSEKEKSEREKDQKEFDAYRTEAKRWDDQWDTLRQGIQSAQQKFVDTLSECRKAKESLPPDLQEKLQKRQEGLDLIGRMVSRLLERVPSGEEVSEVSLPEVDDQGWQDHLKGETNEDRAGKKICRKLKDIGLERYQLIIQIRNKSEKGRKSFLKFVGKEVLRVLDGIDAGKENSHSLVEELKKSNQDAAASLKTWYQTYGRLRDELFKVLEQVGVRPMKVKIGAPIDYNRHEPFHIETDDKLKDEDVKAVTRQGYEYMAEKDGEPFVLRAAQVIAVKN